MITITYNRFNSPPLSKPPSLFNVRHKSKQDLLNISLLNWDWSNHHGGVTWRAIVLQNHRLIPRGKYKRKIDVDYNATLPTRFPSLFNIEHTSIKDKDSIRKQDIEWATGNGQETWEALDRPEISNENACTKRRKAVGQQFRSNGKFASIHESVFGPGE